jgi:hypothetical protein
VQDQGGTSAVAAVTATVCAVLATLFVPHLLSAQDRSGPSEPDPTPAALPASVDTRGWRTAPASITHAGLVLSNAGGRHLQWREAEGAVPRLGWDVPASSSDRWVLVGSRAAGGASRVVVSVGGASPVVVPTDQLRLFVLPGHAPTRVTVTDLGRPLQGEVLRIEEYLRR